MLEGSSGYSKGILVTGSIKKKEATTYTPGVNNITITKGQYLNENQVIKGDTNLKPENIKSGVSLFGINGTYTTDATATSSKILEGETCYANGEKIEGNLPNKSGLTVEASEVTSDDNYTYLTLPESGYYDTSSKLKVENNNLNILNNPIYVIRQRDKIGSTFAVIRNMPNNEYFYVATAGTKIISKKTCVLKIFYYVSGVPNQIAGKLTIYKNGSPIIEDNGGTSTSGFRTINVSPGDAITWNAFNTETVGAGICFIL